MRRLHAPLLVLACGIAGCGASADEDGVTEADAERWFRQYVVEVKSWKEQGESAEAPLKRQDFHEAGAIIKKLGRQGGHARSDFGNVPTNLRHGERLYRMLVDAGDAAQEWALIYRIDPPPYPQTTAGLRKGQKLADAAVRFQRKTNRIFRFLFAHEDETIAE